MTETNATPEPDNAAPAIIRREDILPPAVRPETSNWLSLSFLRTCIIWTLVTIICLINFIFAGILLSEGEVIPAVTNGLYGLLVLWIFGSTLLGAPMTYMAVRQLEKRNFFQAEKYLSRYLEIVKALHLYKDGLYTVGMSNLALIRLARGDYHQAEILYEELMTRVKKPRGLASKHLNALYLNNLAIVKVAQACTHEDLFDLELQEAERLATEALTIWQGGAAKKIDQGGSAYPLQLLGKIDILRGQYDAAESKLLQAIKLNSDGRQPVFILPEARQGLYFESHLWLVLLYLKQSKKEQADELCRRLLAELRARPAPIFQHSMLVLNRLAAEYLDIGALAEAESVMEVAYSVARTFPVHPEAQNIARTFERLLILTNRESEVSEMKLWIRPVWELGLDQA